MSDPSKERLVLQKPEHLTDDYELFGPTKLTILGPDVRASFRIFETVNSLWEIINANKLQDVGEVHQVAVPRAFENYYDAQSRFERKEIIKAWESSIPDRIGEFVVGSQVLVMPHKFKPNNELSYMLGRLSQNENVEQISLWATTKNPIPNDKRIQKVWKPVHLFGWRTQDGHTLRANGGNLVTVDEKENV